jgi:hypothetical protein
MDALKVGEWSHVAAVFDPSGDARLYVGGKPVTAQTVGTGTRTTIAQGYALQRFINACGGRGAMPIKFNGSIFTVDIPAADGDYRRWGGCFWFQNTRLPYWSMAACGDFDLMQPLFRMYLDTLPLRKAVTRLYYNHDGAFYPETMYFWGTPCNDDYRWKRDGVPAPVLNNQYIMRYWQGGIELVMMMLDTFDYTGDKAMARDVLVPFAGAIVTFYDKHYPRDTGGKIRFEPAQSLETWWQATNPMPEVAGLRAVLPRLIALPENLASDAQRREWRRLLGELPPVPLRQVDLPATATASADGKTLLSPAQVYAGRHNCENPELYAIFPYRLYGVGRGKLCRPRREGQRRMAAGPGAGGDAGLGRRGGAAGRPPVRHEGPRQPVPGVLGAEFRLDSRPGSWLERHDGPPGDGAAIRRPQDLRPPRVAEKMGRGVQAARTIRHDGGRRLPRRKAGIAPGNARVADERRGPLRAGIIPGRSINRGAKRKTNGFTAEAAENAEKNGNRFTAEAAENAEKNGKDLRLGVKQKKTKTTDSTAKNAEKKRNGGLG